MLILQFLSINFQRIPIPMMGPINLLAVVLLYVLGWTSSQEFPECGDKDTSVRVAIDSNPKFFPWMGSIGYSIDDTWVHKCGSTLISLSHILTAAHCASNKSFSVRLGDANLGESDDDFNTMVLPIKKIHIHPKYKAGQAYYDVAIFQVEKIELNDNIRPVCLPEQSSTFLDRYNSFSVTLSGWGTRFANGDATKNLASTRVTIYEYSFCNQTHSIQGGSAKRQIDIFIPKLFQPHILCAGYEIDGVGSCKGDSGGPLVHFNTSIAKYYQVAIVSGGIDECANGLFPGIYVRIDHPEVLGFIKRVTGLPFRIGGNGVPPVRDDGSSADIDGVCRTAKNDRCIFPFTYKGTSYSECTDKDYNNGFWCATELNGDGSMKSWDVCGSSCPKKKVTTKQCTLPDGKVVTILVSQSCPKATHPIPTTTDRPHLAQTLDKYCLYICRETGSCNVRIFAEEGLENGSVQGLCFAEDFGGECTGTPAGCKDCKGPCSSRHGETFRLPVRGFPTSNSNNRRPQPQQDQSNLPRNNNNHCLHECKLDGSCSVSIFTSRAFSGSVKGSCFAPSFGGSCSGTPAGCQSCDRICKTRAGQTLSVPIRFSRNSNSPDLNEQFEQAEPLSSARSEGQCLHDCQINGGCSVKVQSITGITGSVKGSCFPPIFGGSCSGIPTQCHSCKEVCKSRLGEQVTTPIKGSF